MANERTEPLQLNLGSLRSAMSLTLHTHHASRIWHGRAPTEGRPGIIGLNGFISAMNKMKRGAEQDDLFEEAVRILLKSKRGSASLLQRALGIGAISPVNFLGTLIHTRNPERPFHRLARTGKSFETIFFGSRDEADRVLASVIQAISGNTGLQSVTMVVRGLATGHVRLDRWWQPLLRQVQTTAIIGLACGVVVGLVGYSWHGTVAFAAVVALSMFVSVNLSGLAGTGIPMLSKRLGFDPALTAGPFETALQDVLGVSIFLSLATLLLRWLE